MTPDYTNISISFKRIINAEIFVGVIKNLI
jgi:hypothetical protein